MKRRDLLKKLGTLGAASAIPGSRRLFSKKNEILSVSKLPPGIAHPNCVLIPSETRGPYPLDLSNDPTYFRQNITEGKSGIPFTLILNVVDINNDCAPIESARVDVWHCNAEGVYSGFQQPGANTEGETFCRGIQLTDENGQVKFNTIFPGWYAGRITHIHFEIYLNAVLSITSQLAFPEDITTEAYNIYSKGQNTSVASLADDNVFSDGATDQMLSITSNTTGGYTGEITMGIDTATSTGIQKLEPETGGQFKLQQNYPNPFSDETTIAFEMLNDAQVVISLFDLQGRKVYEALNAHRASGSHTLQLERSALELAAGSYVFEFRSINSLGTFSQSKLLTIQ